MLDVDRAADEARLRLPPEQPDRHRERAGHELASFLDRPTGARHHCVLDQAYFEYIDDPDYADGIELLREGRRNRGAADVLEDLRPRGSSGSAEAVAPRRRRDGDFGEGAARVRRDRYRAGGGARKPRRRRGSSRGGES